MKVLVIGSGGREHAIAYSLNKSPKVTELHALPGNPGISQIGKCIKGSVEDLQGILNLSKQEKYDLIVIGPEVPLCMGLADLLVDNGFKVFGPKQYAAQLEGSKAFSKRFMTKYNIPTAKYKEVDSYEQAIEALNKFDYPVVVKADGLAAGKGVIICECYEDAKNALKELMIDGALQNAGSKVVLEEFLEGFECSLLCFTDGETIVEVKKIDKAYEAVLNLPTDTRLERIINLMDGTIDHSDYDDVMDLLYQIKGVLQNE